MEYVAMNFAERAILIDISFEREIQHCLLKLSIDFLIGGFLLILFSWYRFVSLNVLLIYYID